MFRIFRSFSSIHSRGHHRMKQAALYICYYHLDEPLVETQVVAYLKELARRGCRIHLLTFERGIVSREQSERHRKRLEQAGIVWHRLRYHGRPSLPATLYDIAAGTICAARICRKYGIGLVHARSHVPAAMAWALKRMLGVKFLFDFRGMLAEEYVDGGHWREGGLKYRLTKGMERAFFRTADAFVMLTERIKRDLVRDEPDLKGRAGDITVIPCCVDVKRFDIGENARAAYRRERGWTDRRVIVYVGKLGLWYMPEEMARFFAIARELDGGLFFQVLTQGDGCVMRAAFKRHRVPEGEYDISFAKPDDLPLMLAASDAGISFIRACNSKRASSPTKIGEYLAAGLPVAVNAGVGDGDRMMEGNGIGVVLRDFSETEHRRAAGELIELMGGREAAQQCRDYARRELSLGSVGGVRYAGVYGRLLGSEGAPSLDGVGENA
jgi:glycosyltransferase involved in cell wall biosynthesis